jgi:hypothetical protein
VAGPLGINQNRSAGVSVFVDDDESHRGFFVRICPWRFL